MKKVKIEKLKQQKKKRGSYTYAVGTAGAEKTDAASRLASSAGRALATANLSDSSCYEDAAESEGVEKIEFESHGRLSWR
jgi:hypothetical protein